MTGMRTKSFLRREEYKQLATLVIDGKILDVGGSTKSGYHELIKGEHTITTGNIDAAYGCDVVFDAQDPWPIENASYDAVLFINVLEHLYTYQTAVKESFRVLKQNGVTVGVVPFMFNVHGSPNDYFRYTASTLERMFKDAGYRTVEVVPLGTGAFSVIYHALIGFVRTVWLADMLIPVFSGLDRFVLWLRPQNKMTKEFMPLGYYFVARV